MTYKGRFTRAGNMGPGVLLVRTVEAEETASPGEDPVLAAFVSFIERDMVQSPETIQPLSTDLLARAERLVGTMYVDLDEPLD